MTQSTKFQSSKLKAIMLIVTALFFFSPKLLAQQEEILLSFRHPAVGSVYINSLYDYKTNSVYLPVLEIFSLLEINYQPDIKSFTVKGNFISPNNPYLIDLKSMQVQFKKSTFPILPDDYRLGETDFYLSPAIFEEVFGLKFTVEIAPLILNLQTTLALPIADRKAREAARDRMEGGDLTNKIDYPLEYDRKRHIVSGTMIDYSVMGNYAPGALGVAYTVAGGMEALGGDIQGTVTGGYAAGASSLSANNLRWRYAIRDNDFISGIMLGQTGTTGLQSRNIKGIALTNDPIEPRQMYETFVIDGTTEPNSEVEIYVNERLSGFKRADEMGYYRFNVPVNYGTTRTSLKIYTPSGQLIVSEKQMQVPFTFLPKGIVSYNIQAGQAEDYFSEEASNEWIAHANVAMGLTNWLTASIGSQYTGERFSTDSLFYYASLSARIAKQYLINIDAAPQNYYRFTGSVMYPNNLSLNLIYTRFDGLSIFNARGETDNINFNIYLPFKIFGISTGLRLGGEQVILPTRSLTTLRTDFSAQLGKVAFRFNYRDAFEASNSQLIYGNGVLSTTATYTIQRKPGIPVYVQGMYLRANNEYDVRHNQLQATGMEISRTVLKSGRLNIGVNYNHVSKSINSQAGFTLDLSKFRSTTTVTSTGNTFQARQSINGSIGWDMPNDALTASNRQQVGKSGVSVVLFVDNNNSGKYDAGDQLLPFRCIKLDRSATTEVGRDSIIRLSQLQSYYKYNFSVNRNSIPDPTLVPLKDKFSFIADPNQYKRLEIPFYRGATIEGSVLVKRDNQTFGQGGLRLNLKSIDTDFSAVIRTMNDGGFYSMDLAPGKYTLEVDPAQLGFLDVIQQEKLTFTIEPKSEGDYKEGLTIILIPAAKVKP